MSLVYTAGPRFLRPNEVIERLRETRTTVGLSDTDFQILGAGDFQKAIESGTFVQAAPVALYIMCGNSSANLVTDAGLAISDVSHAVDVVLYARSQDDRSQYNDQLSVWFKEYLIRSLQGYQPYDGAEPILPAGDSLQQIRNVADYARVFQFAQTVRVDGADLIGDGEFDDLDDFLQVFNEMVGIAPDFDEETPEIQSTVELQP